jgi:hypothetical protein
MRFAYFILRDGGESTYLVFPKSVVSLTSRKIVCADLLALLRRFSIFEADVTDLVG